MAGTGGGAVTVQGGLGVWTDGGAVSLASGQSASGATGGVSAKSADGGTTGAVELRSGQAAVGESGSVVVIENGYVLELATFPLRLVSVRPTQEVCLSSVQSYLLTCGLRGSRHSCDSGKRFRGKVTLAAGAGSIGGGDVELAAGEAADGMQGGAVKMAGGSGSGGVVMTG